MAASIAKLAIQISTDTKAMSEGFRRAQESVKQLDTNVRSSGSGMSSMQAIGLKLAAAFVTMQKVVSLAKAELRFFINESIRMQDEMAKLTGQTETFSTTWQKLKDRIGLGGGRLIQEAQGDLNTFLVMVDKIQERLGFEPTGKLQKELAAAAAESKRIDEQLEKNNKRIAEQAKEFAKVKAQADDLTKSLRTPGEALQAGISELRNFLNEGLITQETVVRGAKRLADEYERASNSATELKNIRPNVGALQKGTTAEFSGRLEAQFAAKQQAEAIRRVAAAQATTNGLLRDILGEVSKPPVVLNKGRF